MTKKKKADDYRKRRNMTAHDRAMRDPEVQGAFRVLRSNWNKLTPRQKGEEGEQLQKLVDSGCSVRGLERDLGEAASNLRRYMAQANGSDKGNDWAAMLEHTLTKKRPEEDARKTRAAARQMPPKIPPKQEVRPISKQKHQEHDHEQPSKAQRIRKLPSPSPTTAKEPPAKKGAVNEQEDRAREDVSQMSPRDQFMLSRGPMTPGKMWLLEEMSKSFERTPHGDARSMKRQGRPLPPTD